jgi:hypothetical protein
MRGLGVYHNQLAQRVQAILEDVFGAADMRLVRAENVLVEKSTAAGPAVSCAGGHDDGISSQCQDLFGRCRFALPDGHPEPRQFTRPPVDGMAVELTAREPRPQRQRAAKLLARFEQRDIVAP